MPRKAENLTHANSQFAVHWAALGIDSIADADALGITNLFGYNRSIFIYILELK